MHIASWIASRLEPVGVALYLLARLGLISASAVAAATGQFVLAGILALIAVGMFIRIKRGKVSE